MRHALLAVSVALCVAACTANVKTVNQLDSAVENPRVVLMPPDIRYYRIATGGLIEPNKEWSDAAQANFADATRKFAESIGADLKILGKDNLGTEEIRYETLYSAVGAAIQKHAFGVGKLPSKNGEFDWSLGPGVSVIGDYHNADYALFVYYRDYQASTGRNAVAAVAAYYGAGVEAGSESGFASLVDLKTGDIVWFNVVKAGSGELRNASGADAAVKTLFKDIPGS